MWLLNRPCTSLGLFGHGGHVGLDHLVPAPVVLVVAGVKLFATDPEAWTGYMLWIKLKNHWLLWYQLYCTNQPQQHLTPSQRSRSCCRWRADRRRSRPGCRRPARRTLGTARWSGCPSRRRCFPQISTASRRWFACTLDWFFIGWLNLKMLFPFWGNVVEIFTTFQQDIH